MKAVVIGSMISAFVIGSGGGLMIGLAAGNGKLNQLAVILIIATGLTTAAKDYRSLMKLPPVKVNGGDTAPPFPVEPNKP